MQVRTIADFKQLGTVQNRAIAQTDLINVETRTIPFIIVSNDNAGLRYDWWEDEVYEEVLRVDGAKFDTLNTFFKDHEREVDYAIGKVINCRVEKGQIKCDVVFGSDDDSLKIFKKYVEGILTDVSIGYVINEVITTERKDQITLVEVVDYEIVELSAVWRGFDKKAKIGRVAQDIKKEVKDIEANEFLKQKAQRERRLQLAEKL